MLSTAPCHRLQSPPEWPHICGQESIQAVAPHRKNLSTLLRENVDKAFFSFWAAAPKGTMSCRTQGTFVRPFVCSFVRPPPFQLKAQIPASRPNPSLKAKSQPLGTIKQTNESSPVFYRTSSPSGPLPCLPSPSVANIQSRATGIADHILPLGDWLHYCSSQNA